MLFRSRSLRFYETVFGGRILSRGNSSGAPGYIQIANTWLIVNIGGGPTPDKPTVTLSVPADPDSVSSFMNIRVADIHACYEQWRNRGAEFITEPKDKNGDTCCYIRDPDGYIIEVGQSKGDANWPPRRCDHLACPSQDHGPVFFRRDVARARWYPQAIQPSAKARYSVWLAS